MINFVCSQFSPERTQGTHGKEHESGMLKFAAGRIRQQNRIRRLSVTASVSVPHIHKMLAHMQTTQPVLATRHKSM